MTKPKATLLSGQRKKDDKNKLRCLEEVVSVITSLIIVGISLYESLHVASFFWPYTLSKP